MKNLRREFIAIKEDYLCDLKLSQCKDLSKEWIITNYLSSNIAFGSMLIDFITCGVYSSASHTSFNSVLSILLIQHLIVFFEVFLQLQIELKNRIWL